MSVYGASFVRAHPDRATSFRETSRLIRERNASWLAASPTNLTAECTVRATEGSQWISIQGVLAAESLRTISGVLGTTAIHMYGIDEQRLRFSYTRFEHGLAVRSLEYAEGPGPSDRGAWTKVEGAPESWEALLFSPRRVERYRRYHRDEVKDGRADTTITQGSSIPWACEVETIAEIAAALQLPWQPRGDAFPVATETELIPGSEERRKANGYAFAPKRR